MSLVIGCDESGTGAWAGPFYIGAVACDVVTFNSRVGRYLKDSKKLSDLARRKLVPRIRDEAVACVTVEVTVPDIERGPRQAWRFGVVRAVDDLWLALSKAGVSLQEREEATFLIDGPKDFPLNQLLLHRHPKPTFEIEADAKYPAVMAAAILAKTARNDAMLQLDGLYPEFGWGQNSGYGVPAHLAACREFGVTPHHRGIPKLRGMKTYERRDWFGSNVAESGPGAAQDTREGEGAALGAGQADGASEGV